LHSDKAIQDKAAPLKVHLDGDRRRSQRVEFRHDTGFAKLQQQGEAATLDGVRTPTISRPRAHLIVRGNEPRQHASKNLNKRFGSVARRHRGSAKHPGEPQHQQILGRRICAPHDARAPDKLNERLPDV
jgi:hypothetical protein